ncbi:MAG: exodeoxyribonuclease VII large subunit [Clostridia bacterium]|nr:exodeoxyribonuclease VII large subunit [Clostridia bacterium]
MEPRILTVSALTAYLRELLAGDPLLGDVWVKGEIANFRHHSSGHMYFSLQDAGAILRCVMFRAQNGRLSFRPTDGLEVIARGRVAVYPRDGRYQLYVQEMWPGAAGSRFLALQQLKERLAREGFFAEERKRSLPFLPRRVGVVTSRDGAALRDIISVVRRRCPSVQLVVAPVLVQGPGAPQAIARAIHLMNAYGAVDVLLVGRGGGSNEDLAAFDSEEVARAIFHSRVPVVSAVGHETDYTIADLVADKRAPTPSAAAEMITPAAAELLSRLAGYRSRLEDACRRRLRWARERVELLAGRPCLARPESYLDRYRQYVDDVASDLERLFREHLARRDREVNLLAVCLDNLSPLTVMGRGYSICRYQGRAVRQAREVPSGAAVEVLLYRGRLSCRVEGKEEEDTWPRG